MRQPKDEADARFLMSLRGYLIQDGGVYFIFDKNEESEASRFIGPWQGTHLEAWRALDRLSWPRKEAWSAIGV